MRDDEYMNPFADLDDPEADYSLPVGPRADELAQPGDEVDEEIERILKDASWSTD